MRATHEQRLNDALIDFADSLVSDYDIHEFLSMLTDRCIDVSGAHAGGVLLESEDGRLAVAGASSVEMRALKLLEMQTDDGPCVDAYRSGEWVICENLAVELDRWPRLVPRAVELGFHAVAAFPLRLRDDVIGAFNVLRRTPGAFGDRDLRAAQALVDMATIGVMQERAVRAKTRADQLQHALSSRVVIEQAKGMLAERLDLDVNDAFELMRRYARHHRERLHTLAEDIIAGRVTTADLS